MTVQIDFPAEAANAVARVIGSRAADARSRRPHRRLVTACRELRLGDRGRMLFEDWYRLRAVLPRQVCHAYKS